MVTVESQPKENYLTVEYGIRSWLPTTDHKRIALLYLVSIAFFFAIAGVFAMMIRIHLLTPDGTAHPQNAMSCMTCAAFGRGHGFESRRPRHIPEICRSGVALVALPCYRNALVSGHASWLEKPRCKRTGDSAW